LCHRQPIRILPTPHSLNRKEPIPPENHQPLQPITQRKRTTLQPEKQIESPIAALPIGPNNQAKPQQNPAAPRYRSPLPNTQIHPVPQPVTGTKPIARSAPLKTHCHITALGSALIADISATATEQTAHRRTAHLFRRSVQQPPSQKASLGSSTPGHLDFI